MANSIPWNFFATGRTVNMIRRLTPKNATFIHTSKNSLGSRVKVFSTKKNFPMQLNCYEGSLLKFSTGKELESERMKLVYFYRSEVFPKAVGNKSEKTL